MLICILACRHSPLSHYCYWNKWVANPIKKFGYSGKGRSAMRLLRFEILEKVLLRRTKVQCADVLALPPRYISSPCLPPPLASLPRPSSIQARSQTVCDRAESCSMCSVHNGQFSFIGRQELRSRSC